MWLFPVSFTGTEYPDYLGKDISKIIKHSEREELIAFTCPYRNYKPYTKKGIPNDYQKNSENFAGVLTVSVLTASLFGGSALLRRQRLFPKPPQKQLLKQGSEESTGTRTIVDHTGAEVVLPEKIERVVISSILPLPSA
ncbi:MAG: hypothetical protein ACLR2E_04345 [Lachnospiraceae bacterium]